MASRFLPVLVALCACAAPRAGSLQPPRSPLPARLREADRLRREGRVDDAVAAYREILAADALSIRAHAGIQVIGLAQGRDLELRRRYRSLDNAYLVGRLEAAGRRQEAAYAAAPEPWRSLGRGTAAAAADDPYRAARWLRRAVALDPALTWARIALGRVHFAQGRLAEAEAEFLAAGWTDPQHPWPAMGMSAIADRRGSLALAFAWAVEALRRAPADEGLARRVYRLARRAGRRAVMRRAAQLMDGLGDFSTGPSLLHAARLWQQVGEEERSRAAAYKAAARGATAAEVATLEPRPVPAAVRPFVRAFRRGVEARYRHYAATREMETFLEFRDWARALFERETGRALGPPGPVREYSFVGKLVDATAEATEPLVRACAEHGLLLILGQRKGGPPEAMLADVIRREPLRRVRVRGTEVEREAVWIGRRHLSGYMEWSGGGDIAGLALDRMVVIDTRAIARWEGDLARRIARLDPRREQLLKEPALEDEPTTDIRDPAGVAGRLFLAGPTALAGEVLVHEDAHLVDAARHLPVKEHALRNLGLAIRRGFSTEQILAFLERNAQATAIAEGPTPLAGLAVCCAMLKGEGPHAKGYTEIVKGVVDAVRAEPERFPRIDPGRVIVQQLHKLTAAEVRAIVAELLREWGVAD